MISEPAATSFVSRTLLSTPQRICTFEVVFAGAFSVVLPGLTFMISSTLMANADYKPVVRDYTTYIERTLK